MVAERGFARETLAEELTVIGSQLQQSRESQSLSIQEISARTKITQRLLNAIEAGDLAQLPKPVYVHCLVEHYAKALGLDGVKFAEALPVDLARQAIHSSRQQVTSGLLRPIHLYLLYVALLAAAMGGLLYLNHHPSTPEPPPTSLRAN